MLKITKKEIPLFGFKKATLTTPEEQGQCRFCNERATAMVSYIHPKTEQKEQYFLCDKHKDYKSKGDLP